MAFLHLDPRLVPLFIAGLFRPRRAMGVDPWKSFLAAWKAPHDLDGILLHALSALAGVLRSSGWYAYVARRPGQPLQPRVALTESGAADLRASAGGLLVAGTELAPGIWTQPSATDSCSVTHLQGRRFLTVACGARAVLCGELSADQRVDGELRQAAAAFGRQISPIIDVALTTADVDDRLQDALVDVLTYQRALQVALRFDRSLSLVCRTGAEAVSCSIGCLAVWNEGDQASTPSLLWHQGDADALLSAVDPRDLVSQGARGQALHWRQPGLPAQIQRLGLGALTVIPVSIAPPHAAAIVLASPRVRLEEAAVREVCGLLATQLSEELARPATAERASADYLATMTGICDLLDSADPHNVGHSRQVADLARQLAEGLGQSPAVVNAVELAGRLHDLGMAALSLDLPLKPGTLSERERQVVQRHASIGADMLTGLPPAVLPHAAVQAVRHHHERWDGQGYPDGLAGDAIPVEARIVAGAEQFAARLSARSYRPALPVENALFLIQRLSGIQLDPQVSAALIERSATRGILPRPLPESGGA